GVGEHGSHEERRGGGRASRGQQTAFGQEAPPRIEAGFAELVPGAKVANGKLRALPAFDAPQPELLLAEIEWPSHAEPSNGWLPNYHAPQGVITGRLRITSYRRGTSELSRHLECTTFGRRQGQWRAGLHCQILTLTPCLQVADGVGF